MQPSRVLSLGNVDTKISWGRSVWDGIRNSRLIEQAVCKMVIWPLPRGGAGHRAPSTKGQGQGRQGKPREESWEAQGGTVLGKIQTLPCCAQCLLLLPLGNHSPGASRDSIPPWWEDGSSFRVGTRCLKRAEWSRSSGQHSFHIPKHHLLFWLGKHANIHPCKGLEIILVCCSHHGSCHPKEQRGGKKENTLVKESPWCWQRLSGVVEYTLCCDCFF